MSHYALGSELINADVKAREEAPFLNFELHRAILFKVLRNLKNKKIDYSYINRRAISSCVYNFDELSELHSSLYIYHNNKLNKNLTENEYKEEEYYDSRQPIPTESFLEKLSKEVPVYPLKPEKDKTLLSIKEAFKLTKNELITIITISYGALLLDLLQIPNRKKKQTVILECLFGKNSASKAISSLLNRRLLVETDNGGSYSLVYPISSIFETSFEFENKEEVLKMVTGDKVYPTLFQKDFKHMQKSLEVCQDIIKKALQKKEKGINILLYGKPGTGKTEFSKLLTKNSMYLVATHFGNLAGELNRTQRIDSLVQMLNLLNNTKSLIIFDEAEDIFNRGYTEEGKSSKGFTNMLLESNSLPVVWITNNIDSVDPAFLRRMTYCVEFKELSEEIRLNIWKNILNKYDFNISEEKVKELSYVYPVVPAIINNAVKTTKLINGTEEDFEKFIESVATVTNKKGNIKNKDKEDFSKYDINLLNTDTDLNDLTEKIINSGRLDFSMCLYSPPGTGKSLYCNYLGDKLEIEVIHKRVSDLVSCWVGNTEKNIREAFEEAKEKKAMLVFDEADSFFQSRSSAQHSWEVTQVNELLQCMENHKYPFMCTTNIMEGMDEASLRRFSFKVKFDYMKKEQVKIAMKLFFNLDSNFFINGLTPGDFANIQKKTDFMKITDETEITKMLTQEVELKKDRTLKRGIGF